MLSDLVAWTWFKPTSFRKILNFFLSMEKLETNCGRPRGFPLPSPIIQVIFSKLPVSNLPACRLVCKTWNRLVLNYANYSSSSKLFPIPHAFLLFNADFNPYYVNFESSLFCNPKMHCIDIDTLSSVASFGFDGGWADISIINSCNGLLFVVKGTYYIWCKGILNPMTNEFFKLPGSELEEGDIYVYGFGFVPRTKQYKLFRVFTDETGSTDMMEVFTFGRRGTNHNHWRHVSLPFPITLHHCGAYFDGVIYWIGREKENDFVIYALDVETEKIKLNAVLEVGPYPKRARLQPFNGTIYAIIFMDSPCKKIQVCGGCEEKILGLETLLLVAYQWQRLDYFTSLQPLKIERYSFYSMMTFFAWIRLEGRSR